MKLPKDRSFRSVHLKSKLLLTQMPSSLYYTFKDRTIEKGHQYVLSRFAYMHRVEGQIVLESPLSHSRIIVQDPIAFTLIQVLAQPATLQTICAAIPPLDSKTALALLNLLHSSNMLTEVNDGNLSSEDQHANLQSWEFHDLLFHARSRLGRHDSLSGGTFRFIGRLEMPKVLKSIPDGASFPLYKPDLDQIQRDDPPFARVQEDRHSIRAYSKTPITAAQLGEFLYRVARMSDYTKIALDTGTGTLEMEFVSRPYPSGGGLYELELYPVIQNCKNLATGFYYYDPEKHRLVRVSGMTKSVKQLLRGASMATSIPVQNFQVLIILAARFQRLAWKYSSIAYATILKDVGVLYQTMYLAATAMGLAPCGVGCGDADLFAKTAGTDYYAETSVGEFLLGSRPD
jgi:oxazoline/thiazoline dehydrogenase